MNGVARDRARPGMGSVGSMAPSMTWAQARVLSMLSASMQHIEGTAHAVPV